MLAGRETEQRQIDQLLQRAAAGSSGVLVLRGDPGIGKTALIEYAASPPKPAKSTTSSTKLTAAPPASQNACFCAATITRS